MEMKLIFLYILSALAANQGFVTAQSAAGCSLASQTCLSDYQNALIGVSSVTRICNLARTYAECVYSGCGFTEEQRNDFLDTFESTFQQTGCDLRGSAAIPGYSMMLTVASLLALTIVRMISA